MKCPQFSEPLPNSVSASIFGTVLISVLLTAGCAQPAPIKWTGSTDGSVTLQPIQKLINGKAKLVVIFLHGVGDHCPLYALDEKAGWVSEHAFGQFLKVDSKNTWTGPANTDRVETEIYVDGKNPRKLTYGNTNSHSVDLGKLVVIRRNWRPSAADGASVDAVEITWSDLTTHIKDAQLIYDFTELGRSKHLATSEAGMTEPTGKSVTSKRESSEQKHKLDTGCSWASPEVTEPSTMPPRVKINRTIKEEVFDRSLADAILYAGPFNEILQHAVAEGLCLAIEMTGSPAGQPMTREPCDWEHAATVLATRDTTYVVVTHSLGSRMLYNVLINLNGQNWYGDSPFEIGRDSRDTAASKVIKVFTCQMPAVYMMANQFSLLGLASAGTVANIIADSPINQRISDVRAFLPGLSGSDASPSAKATITPIACGENGARDSVPQGSKPAFVAFTDPNDLLSWPIRRDMDISNFNFFNVYVSNKNWRWFGLYEDAATAHSGYFDNDEVARLIACGVQDGRIPETCHAVPW
jgi:hypothetical protein